MDASRSESTPQDFGRDFYATMGKRIFDAVLSFVALVVLLPLFVAVATLVKLSSPGEAFYRQERVGRGGRIFWIAKFRSMRTGADRCGAAITSSGDPRITPIGRVLRRLKLDELPQLWNVLRGDMSLVGPRPEVPQYVELYTAAQRQVLSIRPGITDPASISYRGEERLLAKQADPERYYREVILPDKLKMNLEYLSHMSFLYDLSLVLRTTAVCLRVL